MQRQRKQGDISSNSGHVPLCTSPLPGGPFTSGCQDQHQGCGNPDCDQQDKQKVQGQRVQVTKQTLDTIHPKIQIQSCLHASTTSTEQPRDQQHSATKKLAVLQVLRTQCQLISHQFFSPFELYTYP